VQPDRADQGPASVGAEQQSIGNVIEDVPQHSVGLLCNRVFLPVGAMAQCVDRKAFTLGVHSTYLN
jgi:hypothetical protein